ncbi:hypothetical protein Mpal_0784 [Methanosphaerula palustris E1-9c]|uniref:Uncharacterized protein n=1 Tax=Methanosphaerula palustris (strain ATCC BAA-1556 / DSM 19958 / E1-9c) TaxID=521011 RepID=B8GG72_METPE|nr:hypothetical protein Mpal_0784 [Methanosphaerula palustris E1-9c]
MEFLGLIFISAVMKILLIHISTGPDLHQMVYLVD